MSQATVSRLERPFYNAKLEFKQRHFSFLKER